MERALDHELLGLLARADIDRVADELRGLPILAIRPTDLHPDPSEAPILAAEPVLVRGPAHPEELGPARVHRGRILRMHRRPPELRFLDEVFRLIPELLASVPAHQHGPAVDAPDEHH